MTPYNNETKQEYIKRHKASHLLMAEMYNYLGYEHSIWINLLEWVQADEIYGDHWDKVIKEKNT